MNNPVKSLILLCFGVGRFDLMTVTAGVSDGSHFAIAELLHDTGGENTMADDTRVQAIYQPVHTHIIIVIIDSIIRGR